MSVNLGTIVSVGTEGIAVNLVDGSMSRGVTGSIVFIQRCLFNGEEVLYFIATKKVETKKKILPRNLSVLFGKRYYALNFA